ncbi:mechanosensitive ion channel family protein [Permianibacter aggregans]|uniref:MscS family membrane protein n=1 Tax=Permianibacter aggregans TaxID=1510150 RepID=A0A4R6UTD4_9GAMM|nr:mechanosensitive ion channel family protein [Permianibacter aggregans]QGX38617.1 mechanosensitive ion channel family protein [Permianibacter aggregans]TDQ50402.1 MscS family membrane protein [Permianibacter aggregans]
MPTFSEMIDWVIAQSGVAAWIGGVTVIILLTAVVHWIWRIIDLKIKTKFDATESVWDDAVWGAIYKPITVSIWLAGIALSLKYAFADNVAVVNQAISTIRDIGIVLMLGWFLLRLTNRVSLRLVEKSKEPSEESRLDQTTIEAVGKLTKVCIFIITGLVLLQTVGFSISGVLAFGGIGGLAISFAAKDMLANFFGGFFLYMDRPFVVGDYIRSPDREVEGTVEYIGWRITRISTIDMRPLYVPNSTFTTISVENVTRMTNRRIRETVGIRYEDKHRMLAIISDIRDMMRAHPELVNEEATNAYFNSFGDSSLNILFNALTTVTSWTDFNRVKHDVLLNILNIVHKHGADVAFPTRTLLIEKMAVSEKAAEQEEEHEQPAHGAD